MNQEKYDAARSNQIALAMRALADLRAMAGVRDMPAFVVALARKADADWNAISVEIAAAIDAPDREAA